MLEGQARGHALFHYTPDRLALRDGKLETRVEPVNVRDVEGDHFTLREAATVDLAGFDVVHLRQDPPFDMGYITTTHLLERIHPKTLVVNDPAHVRNAPEKLFVTEFPDLMPPTLITRDAVGAINRVPAEGEARSNMHVGGRPEPIEMTPRDRVICETIGPTLKARGLIFVGIDVIGEYLTEINVTSPTGIREVKRFGGPDIAALVWDAIEARR